MNGRTVPGVTARRVVMSPLGPLLAEATESGVRSLRFDGWESAGEAEGVRRADAPRGVSAGAGHLDQLVEEIDAYFRGEAVNFTTPLDAVGTAFQRSVWDVLRTIPWGERVSYSWVASRMGRPDAVRAVGAANGANPLAVVVPCHRVLGKDGRLVGYGGGLVRKERLLEIESGATLFRRP